jgi:hypothetical protein
MGRRDGMIAFHSLWSAPLQRKNPGQPFYMNAFDLLTMLLSALKWRQYNGRIKLVTDSIVREFLERLELLDLWDAGVYTLLDEMEALKPKIDPEFFWAAGKLFALKKQTEPCVMMDTDFIVWKSLNSLLDGKELAAIHREPITSVYPHWKSFRVHKAYGYAIDWDETIEPLNTAFAFFGDEEFKQIYLNEAFSFMQHADRPDDHISWMVFAEQRLLAILAAKYGIDTYVLLNYKQLFTEHQNIFTHIWGYKSQLLFDSTKQQLFLNRCLKRIESDFPEFLLRARKICEKFSLH